MLKRGQTVTHKSTLIDEYIRQMSDIGISLKSLQVLGDFEFSEEDSKLTEKELIKKILEDKSYKKQKETIEKYISEFMKADLVTQEPHKRRGETLFGSETKDITGTLVFSDDWVDGGVYFYRTPEKDKDGNGIEVDNNKYIKEINSDKYVQLEYTTPEKFQEMVDKKDKDIRYKYTVVPETGELKVAQLKIVQFNYIVEGSLDSSKTDIEIQEILSIDYKQYIEKYAMPYEFLVTLCEITQNPEFVYHVAKLARDTKIILVVQDDTQVQDVKVKSKEKIISQGYEIEANVERQTITTTMTPHLEIQYANTWSFYEEFAYTKEVTVQGPSTSADTTTTITTTKYNPPIRKNSVEKSKQFLGLLRNTKGKCKHSNCYKDGKTAQKCAEDAVFDKGGINVEYLIPNATRTEDPLSKLRSGEQLLYDLLGANLEGSEAEDDANSEYKTKMSGIVEHIQFLMTFPENEDIDILYGREDYYPDLEGDLDYEDMDPDDEELNILYKVCEAEAGGSSKEEIGHVASVVLNRVKSPKFPNTIKGVVYQANQFACVKDGHFDKANPSEKTKSAVDGVLSSGDTTGGAFWFRTEASAKKAGMPTSASEKHNFYVFLFKDPNTHIFYTNYDYLGGTIVGEPEGSDNMVDSAKEIHKYVRENGYSYAQAGIHLPNYKTKTIDCSSYVTWVILNTGYRSANFKEGMYQWTSSTFTSNKEGWYVVKDIKDAKAGDIICYSGHVEIYAGSMRNNKPVVYNCGGNDSIAAKESSTSSHKTSKIKKILRVPI